jgi:hypothetical protein
LELFTGSLEVDFLGEVLGTDGCSSSAGVALVDFPELTGAFAESSRNEALTGPGSLLLVATEAFAGATCLSKLNEFFSLVVRGF